VFRDKTRLLWLTEVLEDDAKLTLLPEEDLMLGVHCLHPLAPGPIKQCELADVHGGKVNEWARIFDRISIDATS
jgi:hypothetical protein